MKKTVLLGLTVLGVLTGGCATQNNQANRASASSDSNSPKRKQTVSKTLPIGQIISSEKMDPDVAYKVTNKKAKFYDSLKVFGKKSGIFSDYETVHGANLILGATEKYVTADNTYYHVVNYQSGGFENSISPEGSSDYNDEADNGYVKASDLTKFSTVKSQWTYQKKQPYYVADACNNRIWNRPAYTVHYTYVNHVFDRLSTTQLYATKELIKHTGSHYVYLETAKGKQLGWVYKTPKVLIAGKYRDPGKQLLRPKKHEKMVQKIQSKKSTKNRVGVNDSLSMQQRVYLVRNRKHQLTSVLVMGMDNRPVKLTIHNGQVTKLSNYTYRRKPWKIVTNKKKLRTHYRAEHAYIDTDIAETTFYSKKSKKLAMVETIGYDGIAHAIVYRNGRVSFKTHVYKNVITYPLADFK